MTVTAYLYLYSPKKLIARDAWSSDTRSKIPAATCDKLATVQQLGYRSQSQIFVENRDFSLHLGEAITTY